MTTQVLVDHMMPTYKPRPVTFVAGHGSTLVAEDGTEYLDLVAGIAVASLGHAHPAVSEAIADQAGRLIHTSNLYGTRPQVDLARKLAELTGGKVSFFCNSGAESVECAIKLARKWARSESGLDGAKIVCAHEGFHGRTYGALSATGQPAKQAPFAPTLPGFIHVPYGSIAALEEVMGDDVAAVLLEPIQGEAGVVVPPDGYFRAVRDVCDRAGALLIVDEVQTGLGRTGYWLAIEHEDVDPDIVCLAKALGGGLPIGACLASRVIADTFEPGDHASTFGGGPVQCRAALATIEVIECEGLLQRATQAGERLRRGLEDRATLRGRGLLLAIDLGTGAAGEVVDRALEQHVLVNHTSPSVLRLAPPLVITDDEIDRAVEVIGGILDEI